MLACIRISYDGKSATHTTPRRTVFTQRLVSGHVYEVNMAITSGSPFLSIRKSKYQRDMASKMTQLCCLIRTWNSSGSLGWHRVFLTVESTREIRTLVVVFELLEEMVAWGVGMVGLTNNFKFCPLNWKWSSFECFRMYFWRS